MLPGQLTWMDGTLVPTQKAHVPLLTHTLHYGDGAFEGINVHRTSHGPAIFRLNDHLDRLYSSFSIFRRSIPYPKEQLAQAIVETVRVNKIQQGYVRPLVYLGTGPMKLDIRSLPIHVAIATWQWDKHLGDDAARVMTSSLIRLHQDSCFVDKKITGHYINSILAHQEAKEMGFDEALLLDHRGAIAEGSAVNFFMVTDKILQTPALGTILPGITRDSVIQIAKKLDIATQELTLYPQDIPKATEAFFTGTATEICPIRSIDSHVFPHEYAGEVTQTIQACFREIISGSSNWLQEWLTVVQ